MIILDTLTCQRTYLRRARRGRQVQTILALCDRARFVPKSLQPSVYLPEQLPSVYLPDVPISLLTHKGGIPYVPSRETEFLSPGL